MKSAAFRCPSCGAGIKENETRCHYCQSQLATVACPSCFGLVSVAARFCSHCGQEIAVREQTDSTNIQCPQCRIKLVITSLGGLDMHQCQKCGGLWLAKERFEALASARERRSLNLPVADPKAAPSAKAPIHYRPCPMCHQLMNRYNYAKMSGIILDSCRKHGIWFDKDELKQCMTFVESGGLERSREKELRKLETERQALESQRTLGLGPMPADNGRLDPFGLNEIDRYIETGQVVGRLLKGAAKTLWKAIK